MKLAEVVEVVMEAAIPLEVLYLNMDIQQLSPELKQSIEKAVMKIRKFVKEYIDKGLQC